MVVNKHSRRYAADVNRIGALLDTLSSSDDRLWPRTAWPAMRLDAPLALGARGGHGPIRYHVVAYMPGRHVRFQFDAPRGFDGWHECVVSEDGTGSVLTHTLQIRTHGLGRVAWPLIFQPLHDALIEDALDRAAQSVGEPYTPKRWSLRVRVLRALVRRLATARSPRRTESSARA